MNQTPLSALKNNLCRQRCHCVVFFCSTWDGQWKLAFKIDVEPLSKHSREY